MFGMPDLGGPLVPDASPNMSVLNTASMPVKRSGMFGGGNNIGMAISAALNGYLAAGGNPAGLAGLQQLHQMRLLQQKQALDDAQYQRDRQDKRSDFMFEQDYRNQNKPDDQFTQMMRAAGIDPASPDGQKLYRQRVDTLASPPYFFTDPTTGQVMSIPRNQQPEIMQELPPGAKPIGGPTPSASGGFPGSY